jgi:hypothetical protein
MSSQRSQTGDEIPKKVHSSLSVRNVAGKKPIIRISCGIMPINSYNDRGCLHGQTDIGGFVNLSRQK